jgi:hypothetical protein
MGQPQNFKIPHL